MSCYNFSVSDRALDTHLSVVFTSYHCAFMLVNLASAGNECLVYNRNIYLWNERQWQLNFCQNIMQT